MQSLLCLFVCLFVCLFFAAYSKSVPVWLQVNALKSWWFLYFSFVDISVISKESDEEASCHPDAEDNFNIADGTHKDNDSGNKTGRCGCPGACNCSHPDKGSDFSSLTPTVQETMAPKRLAGMCILIPTLNYLITWFSHFIIRSPFTTTFAYLLHRTVVPQKRKTRWV